MTTTYAPDVTDKFTTQFVRRVARELIAEGFYPESDLEDVMQDLLTHLIERLPKFDPDKGRWSTFVRMVVRCYATSLKRHQMAECRGRDIPHHSLAITIQGPDGEKTELANTVVEDEYYRAYGHDFPSDEARFVLDSDVEAVVASLSPAEQDLCRRLMAKPPAQVAKDLGISRTKLAAEMQQLRERFRASGFDGAR